MSFILEKVTIEEGCRKDILKCLKASEYKFTDCELEPNFFCENVKVEVIVGMNGSGKSSLLELIYRIINNFGVAFQIKYQQYCYNKENAPVIVLDEGRTKSIIDLSTGDTPKELFISGVCASLYYAIDRKPFCIQSRETDVVFKSDREEIVISPWNCADNNQGTFDFQKTQCLCQESFYTLVSSFSIYSFISSNYIAEKGEWLRAEDNTRVYSPHTSWISGVMHKNDGYQMPLVIIPTRSDGGVIDVERERLLAESRFEAMLVRYAVQGVECIKGYLLDSIEYSVSTDSIVRNFYTSPT